MDVTLILRGIVLEIGRKINQKVLAIHFQRKFGNFLISDFSCAINLNITLQVWVSLEESEWNCFWKPEIWWGLI